MLADLKIAFYAPLKDPDHPTPSGDRLMARQLMTLLGGMCRDVRLVSPLRTYSAHPDPAAMAQRIAASAAEAERILAEAAGGGFRPDLWFTYHPYHKSPDWIGTEVAGTLGIPYVAAEASYSVSRSSDDWVPWLEASMVAIRQARTIFCFSARDRAGLESAPGLRARLQDLKPFLMEAGESREAAPEPLRREGPVRLLAAAMMRPGNKRESYLMLARCLGHLLDLDWNLTIAGDGPHRLDVEAAFAGLPPGRVTFAGLTAREDLTGLLRAADILAWPGLREAYGMVYLEAAAQGLPAVAIDNAGVPEVVVDGVTGLLAPPQSSEQATDMAYVAALRAMIVDPLRRARMGRDARRFVMTERTRARAEAILAEGLAHALGRRC